MNNSRSRFIAAGCGDPGFLECHVAFWIWRTVPFGLLAVGTFGNVLSLVILSRRRLRQHSTTMYLMFLASSDMVVLWSALLRNTLLRVVDVDMKTLSAFSCVVHEWTATVSSCFSTLLLVLLTTERLMFTRFPIRSKQVLTRRNTLIIITMTFVFACLFNVHFLLGSRLGETSYWATDGNVTTVYKRVTCTVASGRFANFHFKWTLVALPMFSFVPYTIVFAGNIYISLTLYKQRKRVHPTQPGTGTETSRRNKSPTKILLTISTFFLITTLPYYLFVFIYHYVAGSLDDREFALAQLVHVITWVLLWCNFSFNFFLYIAGGTLFKREWKSVKSSVRARLTKLVGQCGTTESGPAPALPANTERNTRITASEFL